MSLEGVAVARGPLARLDPRAKVVAVAAFSLVTALAPHPLGPALGVGLGLCLAAAARLSPGLILRRAVAVNVFVAFLWIFLPWQLTWTGGGFSLLPNPQGLPLAGLITLKANAIFLVLLTLLSTTPAPEIFHALAHLKVPAKLVSLFLMFHRYLFVMHGEYTRLRQAMKVRCFAPGTNLHTYRTYAMLVGMLLVRSLERAERVYQAMLCRGFQGTFWLLDHFHWRRSDTLFSWSWAAIVAVLIVVQWGGVWWS
ncbi:MAG: cobalt ECF transporter T component CbiQ [Deltaproteobacteria bacterium]|nr:cobalt ECF transporter T component CbiQ [Deltaproteobacteria bacterium]